MSGNNHKCHLGYKCREISENHYSCEAKEGEKDELFPIIDRILEGELCSVDAHVELLHWRDKSCKELRSKNTELEKKVETMEGVLKFADNQLESLAVANKKLRTRVNEVYKEGYDQGLNEGRKFEADLVSSRKASKFVEAELKKRVEELQDELRLSNMAAEAEAEHADELQKRVADCESIARHAGDEMIVCRDKCNKAIDERDEHARRQDVQIVKLELRLSTLLKASEGMEKAWRRRWNGPQELITTTTLDTKHTAVAVKI